MINTFVPCKFNAGYFIMHNVCATLRITRSVANDDFNYNPYASKDIDYINMCILRNGKI